MTEKAIKFGKFDTLIGIVSEPPGDLPEGSLGVIFSNAGLTPRVGPNRIYVKIARALARQGAVALRFDLSSVGDSLPRPDFMPVEDFTIDDLIQAMDTLNSRYGLQRFLLMGHCAGAYHSFRTAARDPRVSGVVLINPDGGEAEWADYDYQRKTARYYENYYAKEALTDRQRWKRFFTGQIHYKEVAKNIFHKVIWGRVSALLFRLKQQGSKPAVPVEHTGKLFTIEEIFERLFSLDLQVLLVCSENSTTQQRINLHLKKELAQLERAGKLQTAEVAGADHLFTTLASQAELSRIIQEWQIAFNTRPG